MAHGLSGTRRDRLGCVRRTLLVVAGLATVFTQSQLVFELIKWAGVTYLAYLGIRSFLTRPSDQPDETPESAAGRMMWARRDSLIVALEGLVDAMTWSSRAVSGRSCVRR